MPFISFSAGSVGNYPTLSLLAAFPVRNGSAPAPATICLTYEVGSDVLSADKAPFSPFPLLTHIPFTTIYGNAAKRYSTKEGYAAKIFD